MTRLCSNRWSRLAASGELDAGARTHLARHIELNCLESVWCVRGAVRSLRCVYANGRAGHGRSTGRQLRRARAPRTRTYSKHRKMNFRVLQAELATYSPCR